jgi:hypothetical protein
MQRCSKTVYLMNETYKVCPEHASPRPVSFSAAGKVAKVEHGAAILTGGTERRGAVIKSEVDPVE